MKDERETEYATHWRHAALELAVPFEDHRVAELAQARVCCDFLLKTHEAKKTQGSIDEVALVFFGVGIAQTCNSPLHSNQSVSADS